MKQPVKAATFEQFVKQMQEYAKSIQTVNYAGDDYYDQECWREYFEDGDSAEDTVDSDMEYWDA